MDKNIIIEVNGKVMPEDTYDIIDFMSGEVKIKITYHDQAGYIQRNPEQFDSKEHDCLFTEEEKINISQSMRQ